MNFDISPYKDRLGLQQATFSRIEHDDAIVAVVYKITLASERTYILKICTQPRHYYHEAYFLDRLAALIPAPRIIQLMPPEQNLPGAILMEYLPGELLSTQSITQGIAYSLGVALAKIHAQRTKEYGDVGQQPDGRRYKNARDYVAEKFEEAFSECIGHLPDELSADKELLKKSRQYYDTNIGQLDLVDGPCLTHRDFRPANIIVHNGKLQGMIDWSSSRPGFAEEDFIPLESGEWLINAPAKEALLQGYATVRPVPNYQAIMPLLQLVRAFFTIGYTLKSGTWNSSGARAYQSSIRIIKNMTAIGP